MARAPFWRGCGGDESAEYDQRRNAKVALGIGVAAGAIGWIRGGWGNPADAFDLAAPCALVAAAVFRARAARLSERLPQELVVSGLLALPYALALSLVVGPLWGWAALSTSLGEELLTQSQARGQTSLLGPQALVATTLSLLLTVYGLASGWVLYRRQAALREERADAEATLGRSAQELSDRLEDQGAP